MLNECDRLASGLLKLGLKKGDHVAIWGPNNFYWYVTMLSLARAGLLSVGINPAFQGPEVEYCLKKVDVKAIVTPVTYKTQNYYEILDSLCPEMFKNADGRIRSSKFPYLERVILDTDNKLAGTLTLNEVLDMSSKEEVANMSKYQSCIEPDFPCNVQVCYLNILT